MKTVLIITYYWPPSGGSGVQRWLKFANYLTELGWHPIVVTPENPQFDLHDPSLERDVNGDIEVLKLPIWEPYQVFDRIRGSAKHEQGHTSIAPWAKFIRGNFFLPDPRIFWKRPVVKFLGEYLKQRNVDFIISTGPPHSMHLIARKLKKRFKIPWLADFRDPWSGWDMLKEFHTTKLARSVHNRLEQKVMQEADVVLTVSSTWAREMETRHKRKVEVITNGFDEKDFPGSKVKGPDKFRVSHFGLINEFRYAPEFWNMLNSLCAANMEFANDLEIDLYGVTDHNVRSKLEDLGGLKDSLNFHGSVSHDKVLGAYKDAAIVLLFMNQSDNAGGHIPGKLFEYLAAGRPILALGDPDGDAAQIINYTDSGVVINYGDVNAIQKQLMEWYDCYRSNTLSAGNEQKIQEFSRKELAAQLVELLDRYADRP